MVLLDTGTLGTSREIFSEDADDLVCNRGVANSSPIIGMPRAFDIVSGPVVDET